MTAFPWPVREAGGAADFEANLPFALDDFQHDAFRALDAGHSVLVSAPTGSGKTLVAAYAVHRALGARGKAFYTTPLKALSNQKYGELAATYGEDHVGLLTGDTTLRPRAPVVVMTTEVLRNMLLAGSDLLEGLHTVVLDEVHFLQDPYRGGVWEEVLVLCPPEVRFVCLSATVNNADELGGWLRSVRGDTDGHRGAPAAHRAAPPLRRAPPRGLPRRSCARCCSSGGKPGDEGLRIDQAVPPGPAGPAGPLAAPGAGPPPALPGPAAHRDGRGARPARDAARHRLHLQPRRLRRRRAPGRARRGAPDRRRRARPPSARSPSAGSSRSATRTCASSATTSGSRGSSAGVAAHHAGLVPVFRETVEECFAAGLLKVVFATETLSLGINMPARSVVIERFSKYGGAGPGHAHLGGVPPADRPGRPAGPRRGGARRGGLVQRDHLRRGGAGGRRPRRRTCARPSGPPTTWPSTWWRASTGRRPHDVLRRSFAQWQARKPDFLSRQLERRLAVLEELGYLDGWSLTAPGRRLSRIYHEADLLVAEALGGDVLRGAEPGVLAGRAVRRSSSSRAGPGASPATPHRRTGKRRKPAAGPPGGEADGRPGPALRGPGRHGRADPRRGRGAPGAPHAPAGGRAGHRGGLVGPGRLLRRPRSPWPPATWASWPRATSCAP